MSSVYIGLGGNLNNPEQQVLTAIKTLYSQSLLSVIYVSKLYASAPQGPQDQPDFVNAVALIETDLAPVSLLALLQSIEQSQGKVKIRHWGERLIDLDILLFDDLVLVSDDLTIPHIEMKNRDFVLQPLIEISPYCDIPGVGLAKTCLDNIPQSYLTSL